MQNDTYIYLENGFSTNGKSVGAEISECVVGEIVFNTSMTGYQEIFSDPSYCGQIIVMTYPLIGNYGFNLQDFESSKFTPKAVIISELCDFPSHHESLGRLDEVLKRFNIPAIADVDTRQLTRLIRDNGSMKVVLGHKQTKEKLSQLMANDLPTDQVSRESVKKAIHIAGKNEKIVVMDFGHKQHIVQALVNRGCDVHIVPYNYTLEQILVLKPQGVVLSNGPGDPGSLPQVLPVIKSLCEAIPLFGICMGHQLLALSLGAKTIKLLFGHRGANHTIKDLKTNKIFITSQNHSYAVVPESLEGTGLTISQINLNDGTVGGLRHENRPVFSIQYHPEASPGPMDSAFLFDDFLKLIENEKNA